MYLEQDEKNDVEVVVNVHNSRWRIEKMVEQYKPKDFFYVILGTICIIVAGACDVSTGWVVALFFTLYFFVCNLWDQKFDTLTIHTPQFWLDEIEKARVDYDEREWFLRLVTALRSGTSKNTLREILEEIEPCSVLNSLSFIKVIVQYAHRY